MAKLAKEEPLRSCYVLELSAHLAGYEHAFAFTYRDPRHIRDCIEQFTSRADAELRAGMLELFVAGQRMMLWTVQDNVVQTGIDVLPFLTLHVDGRRLIRLSDSRALENWVNSQDWEDLDGRSFADGVPSTTLDWNELEAQLPALEGTPLEHGESIRLDVRGREPRVETYLDAEHRLPYGFEDLAQTLDGELPEGFTDPDPAPAVGR